MLIPLTLVAPHSLARARALWLSVCLALSLSLTQRASLGRTPEDGETLVAVLLTHTTLLKLDATLVRSTLSLKPRSTHGRMPASLRARVHKHTEPFCRGFDV